MKEVAKGIVALVIIVAVTGGIYAYEVAEGKGIDEMFKEWWEKVTEKKVLGEGDFAEIYYIGYFENKTVFASSFEGNVTYDTPFDENAYNLTPLKIYLGKDFPKKYPNGWSYGDIGRIEGMKVSDIPGLYEALKGMKKGSEKTIELEPDEAFGLPVENGTVFNTSLIFGFDAKFEVVAVRETTIDIKWLPYKGQIISMPQYWYDFPVYQPYWLWENATEVISFNESYVTLKTTPNQLENLTLYTWWEGASNVSFNDTKIWITTTPPLGDFVIQTPYGSINGKVLNITEDRISVEYGVENESIVVEINRTEVFNRSIELPIIFEGIQKIYMDDDLKKEGYSFHELAGKKVFFRVKLLRIHNPS